MPRSGTRAVKPRHNPLHIDIQDASSTYLKVRSRTKPRRNSNDELTEDHLDSKSTARLLGLALIQQEELIESDNEKENVSTRKPDLFHLIRDAERFEQDEDDDNNSDGAMEVEEDGADTPPSNYVDEQSIDMEELSAFDNLHPVNVVERRTLADVIFAKMVVETSNTGTDNPSTAESNSSDPAAGLNPKIVELFVKVGQSMRGSGPLPKVMKVLPSFPNWQRYLAITKPENWHPFACRRATNIYISNMKPSQVQFFFRYVILPAVRDNIASNTSLNIHYYEALLRCLYKPAPFFKGFLFPLLEENCTLKEAAIVASVLAKKSISPLHLGASIIRIASMEYSGPRALFLRVLLDKKKDLPYRVLDELVFHFIRISNWSRSRKGELPVLWHQSLLVFSQRYSTNLTQDQKDSLLDVVKVNFHHQIGHEIRRELTSTKSRPSATTSG